MKILIDGYNLLFMRHGPPAPRSTNPSELKLLRSRFLTYLSQRIGPAYRSSTTIVFDSNRKPWSDDVAEPTHGFEVHFAHSHDEADELVIELIKKHSHPKKLLVVSSDRTIQTHAKRRSAQVIASDDFLDQLDAGKWLTQPIKEHSRLHPTRSPTVLSEEDQRLLSDFQQSNVQLESQRNVKQQSRVRSTKQEPHIPSEIKPTVTPSSTSRPPPSTSRRVAKDPTVQRRRANRLLPPDKIPFDSDDESA